MKYSKMESYSFQLGYSQVRRCDAEEVKRKIMEVFRIESRPAWTNRLYGKYVLKVTEVAAIEDIFHQLGIKKIWGKANHN